jgi:transcriptional regulator of aromatic amino acid metabolism
MLVYFMVIWSTFRPFGIFYGHLVHVPSFWYILPVLVCCTKKNLATLVVGSFRAELRNLFYVCKYLSGRNENLRETVFADVARVARVFLVQHTKTGKIYQITAKYAKPS